MRRSGDEPSRLVATTPSVYHVPGTRPDMIALLDEPTKGTVTDEIGCDPLRGRARTVKLATGAPFGLGDTHSTLASDDVTIRSVIVGASGTSTEEETKS